MGFLISARHEGGPPSSLTSYFADSHSASDKGKVADSALTKGEGELDVWKELSTKM